MALRRLTYSCCGRATCSAMAGGSSIQSHQMVVQHHIHTHIHTYIHIHGLHVATPLDFTLPSGLSGLLWVEDLLIKLLAGCSSTQPMKRDARKVVHAVGARPPREQRYLSEMFGFLCHSRSYRFPVFMKYG
jgi:hypothetical protein